MKQYIGLLAIFFFINIVSSQEDKKVINSIMNQWHKDVANFNFDDYFDKMSADGIFIGTDASENWTITQFKEFAKPFFDKKKTWNFKTLERNIYISKSNGFAWFDELLDTWMGVCRGSGVLEKENNEWKIKHYVLSVTVPNDDIQKVITAKKENDKKILVKLK